MIVDESFKKTLDLFKQNNPHFNPEDFYDWNQEGSLNFLYDTLYDAREIVPLKSLNPNNQGTDKFLNFEVKLHLEGTRNYFSDQNTE